MSIRFKKGMPYQVDDSNYSPGYPNWIKTLVISKIGISVYLIYHFREPLHGNEIFHDIYKDGSCGGIIKIEKSDVADF
jgi:hypothetical protein